MTTSQRALLTLGEKHRCNPGISALLLSIQEASVLAQGALHQTRAASEILMKASALEPGYSASLDNSSLVTSAAKAATAVSRMASDFNSLACVLQALGEDIRY